MMLDAEWDVVVVGSGNKAIAAARLGAEVALVARVEADERGDLMLERLAIEGVDARFVARDRHAAAGGADLDAAAPALRNTRVVLMQLEAPLDALIAASRAGREVGAHLILHAVPPTPLPNEWLALLDVICVNAAEAEVLTGVKVSDRHSARDAAMRLLARGVGAAVVQAGSDGDLVVSADGECWLPRIPVESVDRTGAGDAFAGALAVMLAEGRPLVEAGQLASAAAALTTTKLGAQAALPHRNEVFALMERIKPAHFAPA